ncbi:MAG: zinc ribbon domain-containing protein [Candidatus Methanomethylophilaceae archaeon]|nr:zinc ribbon domain-containing protein [Candidatus Methanomethylophilaceae archaeon]
MAAVCPMCRKQLLEGARFCPSCGYLLDQSVEMPAEAEEPYRSDERFVRGRKLAESGDPSAFAEWLMFIRGSDQETVEKATKDLLDASVTYVYDYIYESTMDDLAGLSELSTEIGRRTGREGEFAHILVESLAKLDACDPDIAMTLFHAATRLSDDLVSKAGGPMEAIEHLRRAAASVKDFESEPSWEDSDIQEVEDYRDFCKTMVARIQEADASRAESGDPVALYREARRAWDETRRTVLGSKEKRTRFDDAAGRYVQSLLRNDDRRRERLPIRYIRPSALSVEEIR